MAKERRDWRELCAAVATEKDRMKVLKLMEELLAVLDERAKSRLTGDDDPGLLKSHGSQ
jgi:hypothetical protein